MNTAEFPLELSYLEKSFRVVIPLLKKKNTLMIEDMFMTACIDANFYLSTPSTNAEIFSSLLCSFWEDIRYFHH